MEDKHEILSVLSVSFFTGLSAVNRAKHSVAPFQSGSAVVKIKKEVKTEPFDKTDLALVTASASDLHCPIKNATSSSLVCVFLFFNL